MPTSAADDPTGPCLSPIRPHLCLPPLAPLRPRPHRRFGRICTCRTAGTLVPMAIQSRKSSASKACLLCLELCTRQGRCRGPTHPKAAGMAPPPVHDSSLHATGSRQLITECALAPNTTRTAELRVPPCAHQAEGGLPPCLSLAWSCHWGSPVWLRMLEKARTHPAPALLECHPG